MSTAGVGPRPDLPAYRRRIGYTGAMEPTAGVLQALHLAHATRIPFENLEVLAGRAPRLDLPGIEDKLVHARRGGYCFEHNRLFAEVLRELGFTVHELAARVRYRNPAPAPRTHMLLAVEASGTRWLADVGFGGHGLLHPLPLVACQPVSQFHWTYRLLAEGTQWTLQLLERGTWCDLYTFTDEPQLPVDFEMANHYVSTHPDSRFVRTLTVQLPTPEVRHVLRGRELFEDRGTTQSQRTLPDAAAVRRVLDELFGLDAAAGLVPE